MQFSSRLVFDIKFKSVFFANVVSISQSITAFQVTNVSMLLRIIPSVQILNQDTAADMTAKTVQQKAP